MIEQSCLPRREIHSEGNTGIGIPDGTVLDNAFVQWHSDRTEIMNSSRPPATSTFCLGVLRKSGPSSYELNHVALSSDAASKRLMSSRSKGYATARARSLETP